MSVRSFQQIVNDTERQQIADAFAEVRRRFQTQNEEFICNTLDDLRRSRCYPGSTAASRVVKDRLGGEFTLNNWVRKNVTRREEHDCRTRCYSPIMRKYRLRWLDALIKEFSA
jgi:hypothetical protein